MSSFIPGVLQVFPVLGSVVDMIVWRVIGWCVTGFLGGWIAAWKGYSPRKGILLGIICGPLGLLVGLVLPKTKLGRENARVAQQIRSDRKSQSIKRICPTCKESVTAHAIVCGICGHRFQPRPKLD